MQKISSPWAEEDSSAFISLKKKTVSGDSISKKALTLQGTSTFYIRIDRLSVVMMIINQVNVHYLRLNFQQQQQ